MARKSSRISDDQKFDITHEYYDSKEKPNYLRAALCCFGIVGIILVIWLMPKKGWELIVHMGRTIAAGGRHVERPEGETELFPDS